MVRWEPGARQRLQAAALDLFVSQGFEQTTAADIAAAVGLTERTFFRHFADKREVLFDGQDVFAQAFLDGVALAPEGASPLAVVEAALVSAAGFFPDERRALSRRRQRVIDAHPALQERELLKLASLSSALASALRARGIGAAPSALASRTAVSVFEVAFGQWIAAAETRSLVDIERQLLAELVTLTAPTRWPARRTSGVYGARLDGARE